MTTATETQVTGNGAEVAKRDNTPRGLIEQYSGDFATVLPTHIKPVTWVRVAQGALKKGRKFRDSDGRETDKFELEVAAANNPAAFLSALLDAARQGLEPGTEQYYLTPRKVKGKLEILGMRGYQGEIELMYRAGAVASVTAECVFSKDEFAYQPGRDKVPNHVIDWDSDDRGELRLVYAYADMKDGATSKVIVLNRTAMARIKSFAQGTETDASPWKTSVEAMWLKSAVHQLRKWVPTSAEYITTQVRAIREGQTTEPVHVAPLQMQTDLPAVNANINGDAIIDAEVIPDDTGPIDEHGAEPDTSDYHEVPAAEDIEPPSTKVQAAKIQAMLNGFGVRAADRRLRIIASLTTRPVDKIDDLTHAEATLVIDTLDEMAARPNARGQFDETFASIP